MTLPLIRLALISEGVVTTWPMYVAQARGLFEREGIDVAVTLTGSSSRQLQALQSGEYDIGFQQADHIVRAVEQGSDLFIFMSTARPPELTLVSVPQVRSFADLRGRTIAVDGARTGYALLLRQLLMRQGLSDDDYRFEEVGGSQERFDALSARRAAASLLNAPFDRNLLAAGCNSLGTIQQYYPDYPGPIAAARRSWVAAHAGELRAFIRAMRDAAAWLRDSRNRDEAVALLPSRLKASPEAASRAFADFVAHPVPELTIEGLKQVVTVVWNAEERAYPQGAPGRYADFSYLRAAAG